MHWKEETYLEFVEWTSDQPWRMLPYGKPTFWQYMTKDTNDRHFGSKYTTKELFNVFIKEK